MLGADEWIDRAFWMPLVGLLAYAATVLAYLFVEDWPADPGLWQLLAVRSNMRSSSAASSDQTHIGRDALLPEVAEAVRKMDRQIVPDYRRTVIRRDRLDVELEALRGGRAARCPSASPAEAAPTHRDRAPGRRLPAMIAHAANADAVLLQLLEIDDTSECVERAAFWQADLQDIQEALAEVLSGYDPFETAMGLLPPGAPVPAAAADLSEVATALAEAGSNSRSRGRGGRRRGRAAITSRGPDVGPTRMASLDARSRCSPSWPMAARAHR